MAITKKLIHFQKWETFMSDQGVNGNWETPSSGSETTRDAIYGQINGSSIVFIKDKQKIWTHGQLYDCNTLVSGTNIKTINGESILGEGDVKLGNSMLSLTYSELVSLRDNSQLIPGQQYRITDYITTTTQVGTQSAGHQFDIIVTADDVNVLNEKARAIQHEGDTYFAESDLSAWELWYCLDNDTERFSWVAPTIDPELVNGSEFITPFFPKACMWNDPVNGDDYDVPLKDMFYEWASEQENGVDTIVIYKSDRDIYESEGTDYTSKFYYRGVVTIDGVEYDSWQKYDVTEDTYLMENKAIYILTDRIVKHGKGVIYRMIDEWNNECPYDFKNIMFKHPNDTNTYPDYYYTFNRGYDASDNSLSSYCYDNVIKSRIYENKQQLNNIVFYSSSAPSYSNYFGNNCYNNSFESECRNNHFGNDCYNNSFIGVYCYNNYFGNNFYHNYFAGEFSNNMFGNNCYDNMFGSNCRNNIFGNKFENNTLGSACLNNVFGNECCGNTLGNNCSYNYFGNDCCDNTLGNRCSYNYFGNYCMGNSFRKRNSSTGTTLDYCYYNHFDDGCMYNVIWNESTSNSNRLQNTNINRGVKGAAGQPNYIHIDTLHQDYEIQVAKNSKGEIKIYCEADLIA